MDKYEYLTGEDLSLRPSTIEQTKFEYYPLGKVFTKGLEKEEDKKEGLFKRLKNIEDKNEDQFKSNWISWKKTMTYRFKIIKVNQLS